MCQQCYVWIYDFVEMMSHTLKRKDHIRQYIPSMACEILREMGAIHRTIEYSTCRGLIIGLPYDQITYIESAYPSTRGLLDCLEMILEKSRLDTRERIYSWICKVVTMIFLGIGSTHDDHSGSFNTLMGTAPNSDAFSEKLE
jgi:hypothetical protein